MAILQASRTIRLVKCRRRGGARTVDVVEVRESGRLGERVQVPLERAVAQQLQRDGRHRDACHRERVPAHVK